SSTWPFPSATSTSWGSPGSPRDLNSSNRPVRTRMPGGVAGVPRDYLGPLCRLSFGAADSRRLAGGPTERRLLSLDSSRARLFRWGRVRLVSAQRRKPRFSSVEQRRSVAVHYATLRVGWLRPDELAAG